jgi:TDG/mug DNA glycosylase family protein
VSEVWRPTPEQVAAAHGKGLRDVIAPGLALLFCGINPGLYTAAIGHHFGRPGNRFWKVLELSRMTPRLLSPFDERELIGLGIGVTNLVNYATGAAEELSPDEMRAGARSLRAKVRRYAPRTLAILGLGAYRVGFARPGARVGQQEERIGDTRVWVLPNPSGRTASYQMEAMVKLFEELARGAGLSRSR